MRRLPTSGALLGCAVMLLVFGAVRAAAAGNVAVILSADVDAYREALRGFKAVVKHQVVAERDMEGNFDRGRNILADLRARARPDVILAMGAWALQLLVTQTTDLPVVYAMVLNPASVVGPDPKNVTGASMNVPLDESVRLFKQADPRIRRLGVLFSRSRTGYLAQQAEAVAQREGLGLVAKEIGAPREAVPGLEALRASGADALWVLPDEVVLGSAVIQQMLLFGFREKIPLFGSHASHARTGALLALSLASNEDIGRQAGELANRVLEGKRPADLPFTTARKLQLTVNLKTAKRLALNLSRNTLAQIVASPGVSIDLTVIDE